jgi:hypothetical protein
MADTGLPAAGAADAPLIQYVSVPRLLASEHPTAVQLALHAGWTMAVLFGSETAAGAPITPFLPSIAELPPLERRDLELLRLHRLLSSLAARPECAQSGLDSIVTLGPSGDRDPDFRAHVGYLHQEVLAGLSVATGEVELAYELGHQLRDTTYFSPRVLADFQDKSMATLIAGRLSSARIEAMRARLSTLAADLPVHVAAIVAASLGRWSELASMELGPAGSPREKESAEHAARVMQSRLVAQGDLWLTLLISANPTAGLRSSRLLVNKVLRRNGLVVVVPAALLGVALYLIFTYTHGVATVLTAIAAIAGSLGLSARGIGSLIGTLFIRDTDNPVFRRGEEDAMVSDITAMPRLAPRGARRLRRPGVTRSSRIGGQ